MIIMTDITMSFLIMEIPNQLCILKHLINIIEFEEKNMIIHSNNFDFEFVWSDVLKDSNNKNILFEYSSTNELKWLFRFSIRDKCLTIKSIQLMEGYSYNIRKLCKHLISILQTNEIHNVTSVTYKSNTKSIALHKKMKFKLLNINTPFFYYKIKSVELIDNLTKYS